MSAQALPAGRIEGLRHGALARAVVASGLLAMLAYSFSPFVSAFRLPSVQKHTALPALSVPVYRFPKLKPPAVPTAKRASSPLAVAPATRTHGPRTHPANATYGPGHAHTN